ncbi:MAG TPA: oligopeptide transporter, OPT family [Candidatus Polarisedimenticolia bacterium]|nr:oligopeptide transporter, OPT family [Candidatus Polarisedimenticolia bacterium]
MKTTDHSTPRTPAPFEPFVPASASIPEFTIKAIVLGCVFGIIFGAATVYLALRAGLTVSASIPIAVLAIAVFKKFGRSTILENNIVQTIGSAGESIAAGVVFTVPAFLFLVDGGDYFRYWPVVMLASIGGVLGVLFMIPLRRSLIVKEHGNLPYPEGTACAEVLVAGEKGGSLARMVFGGFWVALGYKLLNNVLGLWKEVPAVVTGPRAAFPNATVSSEITPEYLGVGYIIGPRIAGIMVSGSVLSWVAMIPLLSLFVSEQRVQADLLALGFSQAWIDTHSQAEWFYRAYVRLIGAGAVAAAGVMTLGKSLPTIISSFKDSVRDLRGSDRAAGAGARRTERDIPITWVVGGSLVLALIIAILPQFPGELPGSLVMSLMIVVFGFFFVTVSSRIVGLIGSTSNPISGMTIATLMATCLIFLALGLTGEAYQAVALCVGAVVCIAAANAGATSQDLKTGFIVGATPYRQQLGLIIGVLASVFAIGLTLDLLHNSVYGPIGSDKLPAPQPTLMATLIKGLLAQNLPWGYVFAGMALAVVIELCGVGSLAWAVGAYLPISTTFPIFVGGMMKKLTDRMSRRQTESELSSGMLYSTGLVAGGSIAGILIAVLSSISLDEGGDHPNLGAWLNVGHRMGLPAALGSAGDLLAAAAFAVLCFILVRAARKDIGTEAH